MLKSFVAVRQINQTDPLDTTFFPACQRDILQPVAFLRHVEDAKNLACAFFSLRPVHMGTPQEAAILAVYLDARSQP